jgi:2-phospho-L-lactate guanylyltransferase (CobY/MobA/RfbA family)
LSRHLAEARSRGLGAEIVRRPGLAFDLDTPGDWTDYVAARRRRDVTAEPLLFPCGAGIA